MKSERVIIRLYHTGGQRIASIGTDLEAGGPAGSDRIKSIEDNGDYYLCHNDKGEIIASVDSTGVIAVYGFEE